MAFFSKFKVNYLWKMRGYPQFRFGYQEHLLSSASPHSFERRKNIPACINKHQRKEIRVSRDAQNVCAITIVGTVLKTFVLLQVYQFLEQTSKVY